MSETMEPARHRLELLAATGCPRCDGLRAMIARVLPGYPAVTYEEVDVTEDPERFMDLGVLSTPAIRIDGMVVFARAPNEAALRRELDRLLERGRGTASR